ncbi:DUF4912 domain-containing protein [Bacillus salitolerans]|uniref:DUF4912 domain-containing protein n=1 Tax=Bacillus salitolerans TaxID=1437434 RepID=A0ABW4LN72_9BACI
MITEIIKLRDSGLSFREIAKELNSTVGKIHYQWVKYHNQLEEKIHTHFHTQQESLPNKWSLPFSYEIDKMYALPKNSTTIYLYWELSLVRLDFIKHHFKTNWNRMAKCIRISDITGIEFNGGNAHRYCIIPIPEMTNNWFVTDLEPNRTYIGELGTSLPEGAFFTLLRSNPIDTPRNSEKQTGVYKESVIKWKTGESSSPDWLESFSTYSYYEGLK